MRIAFVGKGGSGKTTLSALFVRYLMDLSVTTLAIDADMNQHLADAIGLECTPEKELGAHQKRLKEVFSGENPLVNPEKMIKTTPPGHGSVIATSLEDLAQKLPRFVSYSNGLYFANVGSTKEEDVGIRCYHSKTGSVELVLNHLMEGREEYVVVDMTAGIDAFASGLFDKFDLTCIIVEPTAKSVSVYKQYAGQAKKLGVHVKAIGNKVIDATDKEFLKAQLGEDLLGYLCLSDFVRIQEREGVKPLHELESHNTALLGDLKGALDQCQKDWNTYLRRTIELHEKNAQSWANAAMGEMLENQIDRHFSYTKSL